MMSFTVANGLLQHYRIDGTENGTPLVFSNSLGTDFRIWDSLIPVFADNFKIIRYDQRGHGLTDCTQSPYSIDLLVDDLVALLDQLNVEKIVLCGLSVGGMISQGLATKHPERVRALILCDTASKIGSTEIWDERISMIKEKGMSAIVAPAMERWFTPDFHEKRPDELRGCSNMLERTPAEGYIGVCHAIRDADLSTLTPTIQQPTLVVCGDQDGATPPDLVEALAQSITTARFSVINNAGHIPCIEQADVLSELIRDFLWENDLV